MANVCRYCGVDLSDASRSTSSPLPTHAPLCPVPSVAASLHRAGVSDIAISDYVDQVLPTIGGPNSRDDRQTLTDMGSLILNWGLREGFAVAERHIFGALASEEDALKDVIRAVLDAHRPR